MAIPSRISGVMSVCNRSMKCVRRLQPTLSATMQAFIRPEAERLLEEIDNAATSHQRRASIGDRLADIGDPRPGVGLSSDGFIVWSGAGAGRYYPKTMPARSPCSRLPSANIPSPGRSTAVFSKQRMATVTSAGGEDWQSVRSSPVSSIARIIIRLRTSRGTTQSPFAAG